MILYFFFFQFLIPNQRFTEADYNSHSQNAEFAQDKLGQIIVANTNSVLIYNGNNWNRLVIPNLRARSLFVDSDNTIYVGGLGHFGYLKKETSNYIYHTLFKSDSIKDINFDLITHIIKKDSLIYFGSLNFLFELNPKTKNIKPYQQKGACRFPINFKNKLYLQERLGLLFYFEDHIFKKVNNSEFFLGKQIINIISIDSIDYFFTYNNGIFKRIANNYFKVDQTFYNEENIKVININFFENKLILSTNSDGSYLLNKEFKIIEHLSSKKYDISDIHYSSFFDNRKNLWITTDNGINKVSINSPFYYFTNNKSELGEINDIVIHNNNLFISSISGLFTLDEVENISRLTSSATIKSLSLNNNLFFADNLGLYLYNNNKAEIQIKGNINNFLINPVNNLEFILAKENLILRYNIKNFKLDTIYVANDLTDLIALKNAYIIKSSELLYVRNPNTDDYIKIKHSIKNNFKKGHYFKIFDHDIFATTDSIYNINFKTLTLEKDTFISSIYKNPYNLYHAQTFGDTAYLRMNLRSNFIYKNGSNYQVDSLSFLDLPTNRINSIIKVKDQFILAGNKGLLKFNTLKNLKTKLNLKTYLNNVSLADNKNYYLPSKTDNIVMPYHLNELNLKFANSVLENKQNSFFRYRLIGFNEEWSEWSNEHEKTFTNLFEGEYKLEIESRDLFYNSSLSDPITFVILAPYYRTWLAYLIYLVLLGLLFIALLKQYKKYLQAKHQKEKERLILEKEVAEASVKYEKEKAQLRSQIAQDLHDDIGSNLSSISLISELLEKKVENPEFVLERLIKISTIASKSASSMREIIWFINPENESFNQTINKIISFAKELLANKQLNLKTEIDPNFISPNIQFNRNIYLICKEIINNIYKYSKATDVTLEMIINNNEFKIFISDNGMGFNLEQKSNGNGLKNIKKRSASIGLELKVESAIDQGSSFTLWQK